MDTETLPNFSIAELNEAIGKLLSRGFAPKFLLHGSVSKSQLKNGHLWLTLTDGKATVSAVIWSSILKNLDFRPNEKDGVEIFGKLNFWETRATLVVQVINIRPTLSTVLRQFELARNVLLQEGLIDLEKSRPLPKFPNAIAILTSVPSSAYADMIRTAKERWPLTKLLIFPIPVQGDVSRKIQLVLKHLSYRYKELDFQALVLARGGGSREDLMVFDDEELCRQLAKFPVPVITGIGHEDDLTVADLVADHRSSTPTASIVDLLPSREIAKSHCAQIRQRYKDYFTWIIQNKSNNLLERMRILSNNSPIKLLNTKRDLLLQKKQLLQALSPKQILNRGFCIVRNSQNMTLNTIKNVIVGDSLMIEFSNGKIQTIVKSISNKINR
ncbi:MULTISPECIES: exodeoxyribonuclease VII large subunit [unclassified Prochlorococcus]|uniref:exodeoxyribonuclease VII large subunit n=1 Tax=unclassified Prochlorococcus TaxID=2627481 RepID=UPI000533BC7D|nr:MULTISPECIES: exodeoxyribonuclease VII large subunit [unclassified Prochlorococcus]KGG16846.1 Exodeoxyribonuclease VII large subunit [Prochlorococcus sp. MIT 0602]KGG18180.1 Exodeoxyribonuclease VII large subunit [Prochlorococcus sp. MIT 0603]